MVIQPKHYIIGILGLILSIFIFWVNSSWNNPFWRSCYLSIMTFLFWFGCWAVYFEIRDIWNYRWPDSSIDSYNIKITELLIPLLWMSNQEGNSKNKFTLYGKWIRLPSTSRSAPIILFIHGFSDTFANIQQFLLPLAYAGYNVISYENRGRGKSRNVGNKNEFYEIIMDLGDVIKYILSFSELKHQKLNLLGISLGSMAAMYQGLKFFPENINKIITLATISDYSKALPSSPILFKKKWWVWIRYKLFGVAINPLPQKNQTFSPLLQLKSFFKENQDDKDLLNELKEKIAIIHAKNDSIIPDTNFYEILRYLNLPSSNWLLTKKGGHNFLKYEPIVIAKILEILKNGN